MLSATPKMIRAALTKKMPLLGICGGMQRINVMCGGTLHQHVPDLVGHDKLMQKNHGVPLNITTYPALIQCDTKMYAIARDIKMPFVRDKEENVPIVIMENTLRHQAIDLLGDGLTACGLSDAVKNRDGSAKYLVEAIESDPSGPYADQFLIGVQWHPEFGASPIGGKIIEHLAFAARGYPGNSQL